MESDAQNRGIKPLLQAGSPGDAESRARLVRARPCGAPAGAELGGELLDEGLVRGQVRETNSTSAGGGALG